jgi:hypothetical protein
MDNKTASALVFVHDVLKEIFPGDPTNEPNHARDDLYPISPVATRYRFVNGESKYLPWPLPPFNTFKESSQYLKSLQSTLGPLFQKECEPIVVVGTWITNGFRFLASKPKSLISDDLTLLSRTNIANANDIETLLGRIEKQLSDAPQKSPKSTQPELAWLVRSYALCAKEYIGIDAPSFQPQMLASLSWDVSKYLDGETRQHLKRGSIIGTEHSRSIETMFASAEKASVFNPPSARNRAIAVLSQITQEVMDSNKSIFLGIYLRALCLLSESCLRGKLPWPNHEQLDFVSFKEYENLLNESKRDINLWRRLRLIERELAKNFTNLFAVSDDSGKVSESTPRSPAEEVRERFTEAKATAEIAAPTDGPHPFHIQLLRLLSYVEAQKETADRRKYSEMLLTLDALIDQSIVTRVDPSAKPPSSHERQIDEGRILLRIAIARSAIDQTYFPKTIEELLDLVRKRFKPSEGDREVVLTDEEERFLQGQTTGEQT